MKDNTSQSGNAFFIILLGVVLFAALMYTFSKSARHGNENLSNKTVDLAVTDMLGYSHKIENAVNNVTSKGCSQNDITFEGNGETSRENDGTPYVYTNASAPADHSCHIFHADGGKIAGRILDTTGTVDSTLIGANNMSPISYIVTATRVTGHGIEAGAAGTDLLLQVGTVTQAACVEINDKLGVTNPSGNPPVDSDGWDCLAPFDGTFVSCANPIGDGAAEVQGKKSFCIGFDGTGTTYHLMTVLLAR